MTNTVASLQAVLSANTSSFTSALNGVEGQLRGFGGRLSSQLQALGGRLTTALTLPLAAIGGLSVRAASEFDASMRNINSIVQMPAAQLQALAAEVLQFGEQTRSGANVAAQALYTVVSAGYQAEDAFVVMQASVATAEAGLSDLEVTTNALISALLSYQEPVSAASRYSDILTRTVAVGVGTMDELAGSIANVVPLAAGMGVSFEEVGGALAFMTQRGYSFSEASVALNMMLQSLLDPSEALDAALTEMGYSSGEALLQTQGLAGAVMALTEQAGYSNENLALMFGNVRGLRAVMTLGAEGGEAFAASMDEFTAAVQGATEAARSEQLQSFSAQMDTFRSRLEGAGIRIGEVLIPVLGQLLDALTPVIDVITSAEPANLSLIIGLLGIAAAAGPVISVLGTIGTLLGALFSPIGLLVGSIVALGVVASNTFGGFDRLLSAAATGAQNLVFGLRDALFAAMEGAANTLNTIATGIVAVLTGILTQASGAAQAIVDGVRGIIEAGFNALVEAIRPIWDGFVGVLTGIWEAVRPGVEALRTGIEAVFGAIRTIVEGVAGAIQSVIDAFNQASGLVAGNVMPEGGVVPGAMPSVMSAGWQHGGYTGVGPAGGVAGIVHNQEYVVPKGGALVMGGGGSRFSVEHLHIYGQSPYELLDMIERAARARG